MITLNNQVVINQPTAAQLAEKPIRFDIIDNHTGKVVKSSKTREGANRAADNRDQAYGAVRYCVKAIYS